MVAGRVIVYDTETTGLPPYEWNACSRRREPAPPSLVGRWAGCRIVQMAWAVFDPDGSLVEEQCHLVRPDGFQVPPQATAIHGISHAEAVAEGKDVRDVLRAFVASMHECDRMVAHNISFDTHVVQAEMHRAGMSEEAGRVAGMPEFCTMKAGTLPGQKWPKLVELYERLFHETPAISHKADADVEQCARIYFELSKARPATRVG